MAKKRRRSRGNRRSRRSKYAKSLNYQMHERMQKMNRIGESRHEAKRQSIDGKTEGIFSKSTYDNYKQVSVQFVKWLKENHAEIKHIDDVPRSVLIEYLQEREERGLSPHTISRDLAALNKLFGTDITKKEAGLSQRSYKEITRSREQKDYNKQYNPKNWQKQIDMARAFGIRRESFVTGDYRLREGSLYRVDGKLYVAVVEKGGKFRNAEVREDMQKTIEQHFPNIQEREALYTEHEFREAYAKGELGSALFDRYTSKIDNHAFRREYAQEKYKELVNRLKDPKKDYYKEYDKRAIAEVSKNLGHNRLRVVVEHYLR